MRGRKRVFDGRVSGNALVIKKESPNEGTETINLDDILSTKRWA